MSDLGSRLQHQFWELLDLNAKPENILQSLEYPGSYTKGVDEPVIVFHAYMKFILKWLSNGYIDGILGDLLRKTALYSKHFSITDITRVRETTFEAKIILSSPTEVCQWLHDILSTHTNCPDPYLRLELFRLLRIFQSEYDQISGSELNPTSMDWERSCNTFIHTICDIDTLQLYPRGERDDFVFSVIDMDNMVRVLILEGDLIDVISTNIIEHLKEKNKVIDDSKGARFIINGMKLINVFAKVAESATNSKQSITGILACFSVFKDFMMIAGIFKDSDGQLPHIPIGRQFKCYVDETVRALSSAVINSKHSDIEMSLLYLRDLFAEALDISINTSDLPKLFLSSQIWGPTRIRQHSLMLRNLDPLGKKRGTKVVDLENMYWFEHFISTYGYFEYMDEESGSINTSSNSNDYSTENSEESLSSIDSSIDYEESSPGNE